MRKLPLIMLAAGMLAARPAAAQFKNYHAHKDVSDKISYFAAEEQKNQITFPDSGYVQLSQASRWPVRGQAYSDGRVTQFETRAYKGDFSGLLFVNHNPDRQCFDGKFRSVIDELDIVGLYSRKIFNDNATLTFKAVHEFLMHQQFTSATEVSADLTLNGTPITPTLTWVSDITRSGKGTYWQLSGSTIVPSKLGELTITDEIGFNNHYWRDGSGFSHMGINATLANKLTNKLQILLSGTYTIPMADDMKTLSVGKLSLVYNF